MLLHAGPEIAVASTKAYTAQIAVLAILAKAIGEERQTLATVSFDVAHELSVVAAVMETLIDEKQQMKALVEDYLTYTRNAFYIGRGVDYYVSMEAALKLKRNFLHSSRRLCGGELKHGTIALIEEGTPVIGIVTDAKVAPIQEAI